MGTFLINTVCGPLNPEELGRILTHEHIIMDFTQFYVPPPPSVTNYLDQEISMRTVGIIKQYPYSSIPNLQLHNIDRSSTINEVNFFRICGGTTIVENSSHGLKCNLEGLRYISEQSKVNIIAGTGYYVAATQSSADLNLTVKSMYDKICRDMITKVTGFIGEVGSVWPIHDFERRSIQATGEAQENLNCPVSFHPGRDPAAPAEILRIYEEAGGDSRKAIMSHLDRTFIDEESLQIFADDSKCYLQYDLFGTECSFYQLGPTIHMPSDAQRLDRIHCLIEDKKLERTLMSHDIHTKHRLLAYGGHGYGHIFCNIVPRMYDRGIQQDVIDQILIRNPKDWLCPLKEC